jgi:hypothetical protein
VGRRRSSRAGSSAAAAVSDATRLAHVVGDLTTRLCPARFDALRAEGKAMGDDSALSYAINVVSGAPPSAADA